MRLRMGHGHKYAEISMRAMLTAALVLTMVLSALPAFAGSQTFDKIQVADLSGSVQVKVHATKPMAIHDGRLGSQYLVFDLYGALGSNQHKQVTINDGGIKSVKCGWYKDTPPTVRVVVHTSGSRPYTVKYSDNKRTAVIEVKKAVAAASKPKQKPAAPAPAPKPAPKPVATVSEPARVVEPVVEVAGHVEPISSAPEVVAEAPVQTPAPAEPVVAKETAPAAESKPVLVASTEPVAAPVVAVEPAVPAADNSHRITLDFVATDIHDVLKALSTESGVNVVASPDVKGEVTVALNNVTVPDALKLVTNLSGYKYAQVQGAYVIGTAENLKALSATGMDDDKLTEVCIIKYADATMLTKMLDQQYGMIKTTSTAAEAKDDKSAPPSSTVLVLTGPAADVRSAKAFVEKVEQSLAEKVGSWVMEIYEVRYADIGELASMLSAYVPGLKVAIGPNQGFRLQCPTGVVMGGSDQGGQGGNNYSQAYMEAMKAPSKLLVMEGTPEEIEKAKSLVARVDLPQPQIIIEAKVVDITDDAAKDLGIQWTWPGNADTPGGISFSETRYDAEGTAVSKNPLGHFRRLETDILSKVSALISEGKGKVLASPNVAALDGKPASIFIGDEVKYVVQIQNTSNGINVTTETARVGVQLHTISRISSDGYITMNLHPEVSMITGFIQASDFTLPEVSRRFVDSTIRVKDGETIVIGGLIKEEEIRRISGVPFLKDLPILGELFKNRSTSKRRSEVMMFITPRVLPTN